MLKTETLAPTIEMLCLNDFTVNKHCALFLPVRHSVTKQHGFYVREIKEMSMCTNGNILHATHTLSHKPRE